MMLRPLILLAGLAAFSSAQAGDATWSKGWRFDERDGASIYAGLCAGCHMPDGRGAQGAGAYPALRGNAKLASAPYVLSLVLYGNKAMPALGGQLDDEQIAAVSSYVRQQFGKVPEASLSAEEVKAMRR